MPLLRLPVFLYKVILLLVCASLFILVLFYVEAPVSWGSATTFQIVVFFLPLLIGLTAIIDILMHYYPHSFIISLGAIVALAFFGVGQLNILTCSLVILVTALSVRLFPKMKLPRFRLTVGSKIPKLSMSSSIKKDEPRIRRLRRLRRHG